MTSALWAGLWGFSLTILLTIFVLRWWPGDRLLIVRLVNYAMPWLLIAIVPSFALAAITNRKLLLLTLAFPALYIIITYLPLFTDKNQTHKNDFLTVKVMSYNIWSHNNDLAATATIIEQAKPDILLLQELSQTKVKEMTALLAHLFPSENRFVNYDPRTYLATYSRYPLTPAAVTVKSPVQKSIIETPSGPITIYNAHFLRTVITYRDNWKKTHDQIMRVMTAEIAEITGPVILGGDFNITDQTQTYRMASKQMKNAHWEAGQGFGFTFPSPTRIFKRKVALPPMVRIDHLFYNDSLLVHSAGTLPDSGGSDHLPIVAEFSLQSL